MLGINENSDIWLKAVDVKGISTKYADISTDRENMHLYAGICIYPGIDYDHLAMAIRLHQLRGLSHQFHGLHCSTTTENVADFVQN